jgi:hypothetical protein
LEDDVDTRHYAANTQGDPLVSETGSIRIYSVEGADYTWKPERTPVQFSLLACHSILLLLEVLHRVLLGKEGRQNTNQVSIVRPREFDAQTESLNSIQQFA